MPAFRARSFLTAFPAPTAPTPGPAPAKSASGLPCGTGVVRCRCLPAGRSFRRRSAMIARVAIAPPIDRRRRTCRCGRGRSRRLSGRGRRGGCRRSYFILGPPAPGGAGDPTMSGQLRFPRPWAPRISSGARSRLRAASRPRGARATNRPQPASPAPSRARGTSGC